MAFYILGIIGTMNMDGQRNHRYPLPGHQNEDIWHADYTQDHLGHHFTTVTMIQLDIPVSFWCLI
jgi:hypothetical protein